MMSAETQLRCRGMRSLQELRVASSLPGSAPMQTFSELPHLTHLPEADGEAQTKQ